MNTKKKATSELVQQFFRAKSDELAAVAAQVVTEHSGLKGSYREEICRRYLRLILPARYEIGRGMVYGIMHRSHEADVVLWDAHNYPRLDLADHSFFFAESVRCVLEVKSVWSAEEFRDVRTKSCAVRDIVPVQEPNLADDIAMLQLEVASLRSGSGHDGMMLVKPHIGTAAIFLQGGATFSIDSLPDEETEFADNDWPDVILLLEPGIFVLKRYGHDDEGVPFGQVELYRLGKDALLAYTTSLLSLLSERVVQHESPFYLEMYAGSVPDIEPEEVLPFSLRRPTPSRVPLWR